MMTTSSTSRSVPSLAALLGAAIVVMTHAAPARADAAAGKNDFAACAACHSTTGSEGVGPHLNGVVGRKAGLGVRLQLQPGDEEEPTSSGTTRPSRRSSLIRRPSCRATTCRFRG